MPKTCETVKDLCQEECLKLFETGKEKYIWLDVRTDEEFKEGHIPDAKHIPIDEIEQRLKEVGPKEACYIVYCHAGGRSSQVCEFLAIQGFKNLFNLEGGLSHWKGPVK